MIDILSRLQTDDFATFQKLFIVKEGKMGVVVTFIAILELVKQSAIKLIQNEPFSPIYIKANA